MLRVSVDALDARDRATISEGWAVCSDRPWLSWGILSDGRVLSKMTAVSIVDPRGLGPKTAAHC